MNKRQHAYQREIAEMIIECTGTTIDRIVNVIENPRILQRALRLERNLSNGHPRSTDGQGDRESADGSQASWPAHMSEMRLYRAARMPRRLRMGG